MSDKERLYLPSMAELIDRMSVDTIKMALFSDREKVENELQTLLHDLGLLIEERKLTMSSKLLCAIVIISQVNLHIWNAKNELDGATSENYAKSLRYAHQLNGLRNRVKNFLLVILQDTNSSTQRSNDGVDGLDDWIGGLLDYERDTSR